MKYEIRMFTHHFGDEQLIKTYEFDEMPFVPRVGDHIMVNMDVVADVEFYNVRKVAYDYEAPMTEDRMVFEVMLDDANIDEAWWRE